jgi:hypothetical protein
VRQPLVCSPAVPQLFSCRASSHLQFNFVVQRFLKPLISFPESLDTGAFL